MRSTTSDSPATRFLPCSSRPRELARRSRPGQTSTGLKPCYQTGPTDCVPNALALFFGSCPPHDRLLDQRPRAPRYGLLSIRKPAGRNRFPDRARYCDGFSQPTTRRCVLAKFRAPDTHAKSSRRQTRRPFAGERLCRRAYAAGLEAVGSGDTGGRGCIGPAVGRVPGRCPSFVVEPSAAT